MQLPKEIEDLQISDFAATFVGLRADNSASTHILSPGNWLACFTQAVS